jgi:hypothetical protein
MSTEPLDEEIGGIFGGEFGYRFLLLDMPADRIGLVAILPAGRFDFAIDRSRPRSGRTSITALIQSSSVRYGVIPQRRAHHATGHMRVNLIY